MRCAPDAMPLHKGVEELSLRFSRQAMLSVALMAGALACGAGPTIRQQPGTVTPDRSARTAAPPVTAAPIETVEVEALEPLFPTVSGWERSEIQGEKSIEPVGVTEVHLEYRRSGCRRGVHRGLRQRVLPAPFTPFIARLQDETPAGYERAVKVGD
jgi:hypothetical protein